MSTFSVLVGLAIALGILLIIASIITNYVVAKKEKGAAEKALKTAAVMQSIALLIFIVAGVFAVITAYAPLGRWAENTLSGPETGKQISSTTQQALGYAAQLKELSELAA